MLQTLFPRAHRKFQALPLLGAIADGFDDSLANGGYTESSRRDAMRMLKRADAVLRRLHAVSLANMPHSAFDACWRELKKTRPCQAGTVRSVERYLSAAGMLETWQQDPPESPAAALGAEYAAHLREVRGLADSTASYHEYAAGCFLRHLENRSVPLRSVRSKDIDEYIILTGKRLSRASLQCEVAVVRGLLRYFASDGRAPAGLDRQIDSPRLYQLEKLPKALPWETVKEILKAIDTKSAMGLRDYAMLLMIATYGLRASEVVAITLDDIRWRQGSLRVYQRKTSSPLELPLTDEVAAAVVKHLKQTPPPAPYRRVFLRMRAPMGVLKPSAVMEVFQSAVRQSGLNVPLTGAHCLRHSLAIHLLRKGTPLKTIGDILGHRTAQSTSTYLRLATGDLRQVSLSVPSMRAAKEVR